MATKYFCDGCGKERTINELTKVTITWPRKSYSEQERTFDLDDYCLAQFQDKFPDRWPQLGTVAVPAYDPTKKLDLEDIPF